MYAFAYFQGLSSYYIISTKLLWFTGNRPPITMIYSQTFSCGHLYEAATFSGPLDSKYSANEHVFRGHLS